MAIGGRTAAQGYKVPAVVASTPTGIMRLYLLFGLVAVALASVERYEG